MHNQIVPINKRNSDIPSRVAEVIDRALNDEIKDRYKNASNMRKALKKVL
ncbi:hypothetical protein ACFL5F_01405 [Planctomycetota bacterium]